MNSTEQHTLTNEVSSSPCSLLRRLAAIVYDSVLMFCVVFIAWQPVPLISDMLPETIDRGLKLGYLLTICFLYFAWSWTHGGQTLGMRAWKIKLQSLPCKSNRSISWRTAWLRFIGAMASWLAIGIGFFWSVFHHDKLAWHDIFSNSHLVVER